jgi:hypothetical protein
MYNPNIICDDVKPYNVVEKYFKQDRGPLIKIVILYNIKYFIYYHQGRVKASVDPKEGRALKLQLIIHISYIYLWLYVSTP